MTELITQYPWLVFLVAFFLGMLVMWLLELFILRRNIKTSMTSLEVALKQRDAELQLAQTAQSQTNASLKEKEEALEAERAAHAAAEKQLAEYKTQLARSAGDLDTALKQRQQLEAALDARSNELNQLREEAATLRDDLSNLRESNSNALAELARVGAAAAASAAVISELEESKRELTAGALASAELIKQLEADRAALTDEAARLSSELEKTRTAKALSDSELAELKLQLSTVETALGITAKDKEVYQETLAARVEELTSAKAQLAQLKADNDSLLSDVARFTARAAAAAAAIQALENDKRELSAQVRSLREELAAARAAAAAPVEALAVSEPTDNTAEPSVAEPAPISSQPDTASPSVEETQKEPAAAAEAESPQAYEAICPQDLSAVKGIGAEYEQRLYRAGIGTYWDLAQTEEEDLARILELNEAQRAAINLAEIRGDALRLARQTKTQKRTWKGGVPDDFDMLIGIGRVYEGRLYEAGICTFEALAACTPAQLASICHAPQFNQNHYQSWIDQARVLVEARRKGI